MKVFDLYNADGSFADLGAAVKAVPDRVLCRVDPAQGTYTVYQQGDALPEPSAEARLTGARSAALEALRLRKWQAKEAGITVSGIKIDTDSTGQETISGAALNCLINPDFKAKWKTAGLNPDGTAVWAEVGKAEIMALAAALTAHTEACFAVEEKKQAEIAKLENVEAINAWLESELDKGWPNG